MTTELIEQPQFDIGIERLIAMVEVTLQGQHIHPCFACGKEFKCACQKPEEKLICAECDGEVF